MLHISCHDYWNTWCLPLIDTVNGTVTTCKLWFGLVNGVHIHFRGEYVWMLWYPLHQLGVFMYFSMPIRWYRMIRAALEYCIATHRSGVCVKLLSNRKNVMRLHAKRSATFYHIYIERGIKMSLKQIGHFATNGFVSPLVRQMLQNTVK